MNKKLLKEINKNNYDFNNALKSCSKNESDNFPWKLLNTFNNIVSELTNNIADTKKYLSTCSYDELINIGDILPEIYYNLLPTSFLECFKDNINRFDDPKYSESLQDAYNYTLYAIHHIDKKLMSKLALIDDALWKDFENKGNTVEIENYNFQTEQNNKKRVYELTKNLSETINYLDTCNKDELYWTYQILEDITDYFKSIDLLNCIKRNITRFDDKNIQEVLQEEYSYCAMVIKAKGEKD